MLVPDLRVLAQATRPPDARVLGQLRELAFSLREGEASDLASGLEAAIHLVEASTAAGDLIDRRAIATTARRLFELLDEPVREHVSQRAAEDPAPSRSEPSLPAGPRSLPLGAGEPPPAPTPAPTSGAPERPEVLGEILARLGHVDEDQIEAALALQRERALPLGDCLLILGAVTPDQLFSALRLQRKLSGEPERAVAPRAGPIGRVQIPVKGGRRKAAPREAKAHRQPIALRVNSYLGEVLLGTGWVTQEQLREAMQRHNLDGVPLGEALVGLGFLTSDDLHRALELQRSLQSIARGH